MGAEVDGPLLTKAGDDITTDHIIPASSEALTLWSDPEAAAEFTLERVDEEFLEKAREAGGGWIVAGENWGQGSARENAALELAVLGVDGVLAKSFARIHFANLVNFGLLPLRFADPGVYDRLEEKDEIAIVGDVADQLREGASRLSVRVNDGWEFDVVVDLTADLRETVLAGGKLAEIKRN